MCHNVPVSVQILYLVCYICLVTLKMLTEKHACHLKVTNVLTNFMKLLQEQSLL